MNNCIAVKIRPDVVAVLVALFNSTVSFVYEKCYEVD